LLYEYDGALDKAQPDFVVFPESTQQVQAVVKLANTEGVPFAPGLGRAGRQDPGHGIARKNSPRRLKAERTGVPKMKAEQAVDALFHSMKEALARGERIELRGFGVFVVKPRKRGVGRNPRTGEEVAIPSGKTIRFKPGKELQAHGFEAEDESHDEHAEGAVHDTDAGPGF